MTTFVAVYQGATINSASLQAVSTAPAIIQKVCEQLLQEKARHSEDDPVLVALEGGRCQALQMILEASKKPLARKPRKREGMAPIHAGRRRGDG